MKIQKLKESKSIKEDLGDIIRLTDDFFYDYVQNIEDADWVDLADLFRENGWVSDDNMIIPKGTTLKKVEHNQYYNLYQIVGSNNTELIPIRLEDEDELKSLSIKESYLKEDTSKEWKPNTSFKHIKDIYNKVKANNYKYVNNEREEFMAAVKKADNKGYKPEECRQIKDWHREIWQKNKKNEDIDYSQFKDIPDLIPYTPVKDTRKWQYSVGGVDVPYTSYEEAKAHLKDDYKITDYRDELQKYIDKETGRPHKFFVDETFDGRLCIDINYGDWKHEHWYADSLVKEFFMNKGLGIEIEEDVTLETGSDTYSACHYYEIDDLMLSGRVVEGSLKEDLTDPSEVIEFKKQLSIVDNIDDIQELINGLSDGVAEDLVQQAFDANEMRSIGEVKSAVLSALDVYLEDNCWLGESLESNIKHIYYHNDPITGLRKGQWVDVKEENGKLYGKWSFQGDDGWHEITNIEEMPYHNFHGARPAKTFTWGGWRHWLDDEVEKFWDIEGKRISGDFEIPGMPHVKRKLEDMDESLSDYRFEVSCNDGPTKVIRTVAETEDRAVNYVKNMYAQEYSVYADDRANEWYIKNLYSGTLHENNDFDGDIDTDAAYRSRVLDQWNKVYSKKFGTNAVTESIDDTAELNEASKGFEKEFYNGFVVLKNRAGDGWDIYSYDGTPEKVTRAYLEDEGYATLQAAKDEIDKWYEEAKLDESSYGGAFDIADDEYFTRDDIVTASEKVLDHVNETFKDEYTLGGTWFENGNWIVNVQTQDGMEEYEVEVPVSMRRIRKPSDIEKYVLEVASKLIAQIKEYNGLDEAFSGEYSDKFYGLVKELEVDDDIQGLRALANDVIRYCPEEDVKDCWYDRGYQKRQQDEEDRIAWLNSDDDDNLDEDYDGESEKGPKEGADAGIADLLSSAIIDEWEAIKEYNDLAINARAEGFNDVATIVDDINTEENIHVGQLQQALTTISPNASVINQGEQEARDQLSGGSANEINDKVELDDIDDDF